MIEAMIEEARARAAQQIIIQKEQKIDELLLAIGKVAGFPWGQQ